MNILRQFHRKDDSDSPSGQGRDHRPEREEKKVLRFNPIPCIEGITWIEDDCLHKSRSDTEQSFRLSLKEIQSIHAEWMFQKENLHHAQTSLDVYGTSGSIISYFGPIQYAGMISLTGYLHRIFTREEYPELTAMPAEGSDAIGPYPHREGLIWADTDFLYLGPSVAPGSTRVPVATIRSVRARWERRYTKENIINLTMHSSLGGSISAYFDARQAPGLFTIVNHINRLRTSPAG